MKIRHLKKSFERIGKKLTLSETDLSKWHRSRKISAHKSVQSDRNTFLNLFSFQHDAVERPFLLVQFKLKYTRRHTCAHTLKKLPYKVQPHLVCVYCSLSKCENYTIAESTKDHCVVVVVESAYYEPSVGIQAFRDEMSMAVCIHFWPERSWGKTDEVKLVQCFSLVLVCVVCAEHSHSHARVLYHLFFARSYAKPVVVYFQFLPL